jgi:hypothetical protein
VNDRYRQAQLVAQFPGDSIALIAAADHSRGDQNKDF